MDNPETHPPVGTRHIMKPKKEQNAQHRKQKYGLHRNKKDEEGGLNQNNSVRTRVLVKSKQFLFLIKHQQCCSYNEVQ